PAAAAAAGAAALSATPGEMPRFAAPAPGAVVQAFDGEQNKGIDIAGQAGDPVAVAADGKIAFVGTELAGYGRTVIVEHGGQVISAYAHVRNIRVREQQTVRQGDVIAEIDDGTGGESRLHFEIRRQGVAVDPQLYMAR
ncbi:murein hydrolase activator EnvC family protein, partial [Pseudacidovorax intermedius]|uniref:murein hydrolase activator EnvC family protein n=1 Tax=Pseudacidovorax intermedius TaxID=433924 RepID=UPI0005C299C4